MKKFVTPDKFTLVSILKGFRSVEAIEQGREIHEEIIKSGFGSDLFIGNTLVNMYAKCGSLKEACEVFDGLPNQDVVSWGALIVGYAQHGHGDCILDIFDQMQREGVNPSNVVFSCVLKACGIAGSIITGRLVHQQIVRSGLGSDLVIGNTLIDMYVKCKSMEDARKIFDELPHRDVVSWGSIIVGSVRHGDWVSAVDLFKMMQQEGIEPNAITYSCILKACASMGDIGQGRLIHQQISRSGLQPDNVIGSSLVDMYAKCWNLEKARAVFDDLQNRDVVTWGAMISGYVMHGHGYSALNLFEKMEQESIKPNGFIFSCIFKACSSIEAIREGRCMHKRAIESGFREDMVVANTLIDMYVKCGCLDDAKKMFEGLLTRDAVSWGAMIAGYAQHGEGPPAVELFKNMQQEGIRPSSVTFSCILKACGTVGAVTLGRFVHSVIAECGMDMDLIIGNTLVDTYARCGSLVEAYRVFQGLLDRDVVSWGAIIGGCATQGNTRLARQLFEEMQMQGLKPDDVIFTSLLAAHCQVGLLEEGSWYFQCMTQQHGLMASIEHYNCMVGLLGQAGYLQEAADLLQTLPFLPDIIICTSLLTSCRLWGNVELGRRCFDQVVQYNSNDASAYVLMASMYGEAHLWKDSLVIEGVRKCSSAPKKPGKAWIEANNRILEFVVGGNSQTQCVDIHVKLVMLNKQLKKGGYMPHLDLVVESMSDTLEDV